MKYESPKLDKEAFNCPHCEAFAHQIWSNVYYTYPQYSGYYSVGDFKLSKCVQCEKFAFWVKDKIIFPDIIGVHPPNSDLAKDIQEDYLEAASILNKSPRGACALLRLCIQKLCNQLGESNNELNIAIANLVKKGLPVTIQQALDTVRVIGNEAIHPGELDLKDNIEIANKLFDLINIITQIMITQPKEIEALYKSLPKSKLDAIKYRDNVNTQNIS